MLGEPVAELVGGDALAKEFVGEGGGGPVVGVDSDAFSEEECWLVVVFGEGVDEGVIGGPEVFGLVIYPSSGADIGVGVGGLESDCEGEFWVSRDYGERGGEACWVGVHADDFVDERVEDVGVVECSEALVEVGDDGFWEVFDEADCVVLDCGVWVIDEGEDAQGDLVGEVVASILGTVIEALEGSAAGFGRVTFEKIGGDREGSVGCGIKLRTEIPEGGFVGVFDKRADESFVFGIVGGGADEPFDCGGADGFVGV